MSKRKAARTIRKTVVIKMNKTHRVSVFILSAFLIVCMLASMIYLISLAEFGLGIELLLCVAAIVPFLPLPLYYATWQIIFNADGIQKQLFLINQEFRTWSQIKEVHSTWLTSKSNHIISIKFKNGKTIRFRMDCENAEKARKCILSLCSIIE